MGELGRRRTVTVSPRSSTGTSVIATWSVFSADETADVGIDNQTPVAEGIDLGPETRFTGKIHKITLEVK